MHNHFMNEETGKVQAAAFSGESCEDVRNLDLEIQRSPGMRNPGG